MSHCESSLSHAADESSAHARDRLFVLLYEDLHRIARRELQRHAPATLGPTTLLHETFLNVCQRDSVSAVERGPFMSYAARAMRGLIVDYFRSRATRKRGGDLEITSLTSEMSPATHEAEAQRIEKLHVALESLAGEHARLAECVELKFFCGFSFAEIARLRDVSERTVQRDWDKARILLHRLMNDAEGMPQPATSFTE